VCLTLYSVKQRVFVIPFLGYSTMERAVLPGEIVTAKTNLRLLCSIPSTSQNVFLFLDLHKVSALRILQKVFKGCSTLLVCTEWFATLHGGRQRTV
jgi:hypothetical protein